MCLQDIALNSAEVLNRTVTQAESSGETGITLPTPTLMNYISASVTVTQVESFGGILVQLRIYKTAHRISHLCL